MRFQSTAENGVKKMFVISAKADRNGALLKEQEDLKQKMWNALYAEEDELEKKFIGTEEHNDWFDVYRPWLQRGFEIAIKVIAEQDGR